MQWPQEIKERAYTLDAVAWESYSGKPKHVKRYMETRRVASLNAAHIALMEEGWYWTEEGHFIKDE